ncbi:MAG: BRO family protein [Chloroflexota bacterium]
MTNLINHFNDQSPYISLRKVWDESSSRYWFAVVDVIELLTYDDQVEIPEEGPVRLEYLKKELNRASRHWSEMKRRVDGEELSGIPRKFPLKHKFNGRTYQVECADEEGLLRIIQSISSKRAEPLKQWLAKNGARRLKEIENDPLEQEKERYRLLGYTEMWIERRIKSAAQRNILTEEWQRRGILDRIHYAILTNDIHRGTFDGMSVSDHKKLKGVDKGDLRDHMTPYELLFTELGEMTATDNMRIKNSQGFEENREVAKQAGRSAGAARRAFEEAQGIDVISSKSFLKERQALLQSGSPIVSCDHCHMPVKAHLTYGTERHGSICDNCFDTLLNKSIIDDGGNYIGND